MIHIVLSSWQQHTLVELGGILGNILEYEQPGEVAQRLEEIARELRSAWMAEEDELYQPGKEG